MGDEPKLPPRVKVPGKFVPGWWLGKGARFDEGHVDAPLSRRGGLLFYALVGAIIAGGVVLILVVR